MPVDALILVLVAALIHATWNLLAKRSGGDVRFALFTSVAVAVVWAPLGVWVMWREAGGYGVLQWSLLAASGLLHVLYYVTLLRGYRLADLTVVYPLARGTGPLITAMAATVVLQETLGLQGWAGVLGVVGGIVLIAGGPALWRAFRQGAQGQAHPQARADMVRLRAGLYYGVLTGAFIAAYTLLDGYAVKRAQISPIAVDYVGNLFRLPMTAALIWVLHQRTPLPMGAYLRQMWKPALLIGAISPVSYVLVLYAATMAPLSHVAPAREVSMLFAALLGGRLLGEQDAGWRLLGAACIAAGVVALATGA
ncbi:MAG: EamA family transporter [Rubrivivax sp.]|nr:MAG: EamA family transporter [Rubrivivax sp.]